MRAAPMAMPRSRASCSRPQVFMKLRSFTVAGTKVQRKSIPQTSTPFSARKTGMGWVPVRKAARKFQMSPCVRNTAFLEWAGTLGAVSLTTRWTPISSKGPGPTRTLKKYSATPGERTRRSMGETGLEDVRAAASAGSARIAPSSRRVAFRWSEFIRWISLVVSVPVEPMRNLLHLLPRLQELQPRPLLARRFQVPGVPGQEHGRAVVVLGHGRVVGVGELLQREVVRRLDPAGGVEGRPFEVDGDVVLG